MNTYPTIPPKAIEAATDAIDEERLTPGDSGRLLAAKAIRAGAPHIRADELRTVANDLARQTQAAWTGSDHAMGVQEGLDRAVQHLERRLKAIEGSIT